MKLNKLVILVIAITFIAALAVTGFLSYFLLIDSFSRLEKTNMKTDTGRVINAIGSELVNLNKTTHDWSSWDETYTFASGKNEVYTDSNLNPSSLVNIKINSIIIFNNDALVVGSKSVDLNNGLEVETDQVIIATIKKNPELFFNMTEDSSIAGFMKGSTGPVLLVARPILTSYETGPKAGIIVMARNFDNDFIENIKEITHLPVSYENSKPVMEAGVPAKGDYSEEIPNLSSIKGMHAVYTIDGTELGIITVQTERAIMREGIFVVAFFLLSLTGVAILSILVFFYILNRYVLERIKKIKDHIDAIDTLKHSFEPITVYGDDELDSLANSYNSMFGRIRANEEALIISLEKYRLLLDNANDALIIITSISHEVLEINPNARDLLGIEPSNESDIKFKNFFHESEHYLIENMLKDAVINGKSDIPQVYARHMFGHDIPVELRTSFVKSKHEEFILVIMRDITGRKHAEEHLHRIIEQLTRLSQVTSYDVSNQIISLRGYLELSTEYADNEFAHKFLESEKKIVERIERLIAFTRDYQEIGVNEPEWQDLNKVIRDLTNSLEIKSVEIINSLPSLSIYADNLLEKSLARIIYNSILIGRDIKTIQISSKEESDGLYITLVTDGTHTDSKMDENLFNESTESRQTFDLHLVREILAITNITVNVNFVSNGGIIIYLKVPQGKYRYGNASLV